MNYRTILKRSIGRIPNSRVKRLLAILLLSLTGVKLRSLLINRGESAVMVGSPNPERVDQFARLTGPEGNVLFIEPINHDKLYDRVEEHDHVSLDERGAWSDNTRKELLVANKSNPGDNKIPVEGIEHDNDLREESYRDTEEVEVEKLDVILSEADFSPDYIEIMVNGAELEVLEGASETLQKKGPRLLVKGHARNTDTKEPINSQIEKFLRQHDYQTVIGPGGEPTVARSNSWTKRAGDVIGWKG